MRRFSRVCASMLLAVTACLVPSPAGAEPVTCEDVRVPVQLGTMYGRLCTPAGARTVQVLIPGGTYNSSYWDISYTPQTRSYRYAMNKAGFATLAVDRLGTGQSSKPLSALLTATTQAHAVHEVIQTLRPRFDKVILGGHSIGAAMAMIEAGTFHDVDGVLVTDMTHRMNLITVLPVLANMIPAPLDPKWLGKALDPGYLTTGGGTRYNSFHKPGPYVPGAITEDESTKDVFAVTEAVDTILLTNVIIPISRQINVPVLLVVGAGDFHFCGQPLGSDCSSPEALRASEAPFFPAGQLQTYLLGGYGHSINYAPNAPDYHRAVVDWTNGITG